LVGYARQLPKKVQIILITRRKIIYDLLMLISEWGSDRVAFFFAYEGGQ